MLARKKQRWYFLFFPTQHAIQGRSFYSPAVLKLKCGYSITHQQGTYLIPWFVNFSYYINFLLVTPISLNIYIFSRAYQLVTQILTLSTFCFPALVTFFSRLSPGGRLHVFSLFPLLIFFPRLKQVDFFPALATAWCFSRACHWLIFYALATCFKVFFSRLQLVNIFPAPFIGYYLSRVCS